MLEGWRRHPFSLSQYGITARPFPNPHFRLSMLKSFSTWLGILPGCELSVQMPTVLLTPHPNLLRRIGEKSSLDSRYAESWLGIHETGHEFVPHTFPLSYRLGYRLATLCWKTKTKTAPSACYPYERAPTPFSAEHILDLLLKFSSKIFYK
jgi:hypothetical protein